jgi:hypothetical protein
VSEQPRVSPAWLAAGAGLFVLDIALHLPITDFFDDLAKRFGFFEYDAATQWIFLSVGIATVAALWWCPRHRRPVVRSGLIGAIAAMLLAKAFLLLNAIENIHYPQYALLALVFARSGLSLDASWVVSIALGVIDEAYQHMVLPRGTPQYLDANDIIFNGIGALIGVVMILAWSDRPPEQPLASWRTASRATLLALVLAALAAPPVRGEFYKWTPGGRRFHLLTPFEAVMLGGALWAGVRRLAARGSQPVTSGP